MKIDAKIISIPPYISTTWDQVLLIQTEHDPFSRSLLLLFHLKDGKEIRIPGLELTTIELVFEGHRKYIEQKNESRKAETLPKSPAHFIQQMIGLSPEQLSSMPIRFGVAGLPGMEGIDMAMQHNSQLADTPDLPEDMLEKIATAAKLVTAGDTSMFPKPEAHCNCMHCQVSRAIHGIEKASIREETVADEDLTFRDWEMVQIGEALYKVTNPLDADESYNVFLGNPIGCTCGETHCEHVRFVLAN